MSDLTSTQTALLDRVDGFERLWARAYELRGPEFSTARRLVATGLLAWAPAPAWVRVSPAGAEALGRASWKAGTARGRAAA
jgi:hypothetical protein